MALYRARETFFYGQTKISRGQIVRGDDPLLKGRAHLFVAIDPEPPTVEQMTATPGERRRVSTTRRGRR